jgi:hypothetical protein
VSRWWEEHRQLNKGEHHRGRNQQGLTYISADEWASQECQQEEIAIGCSNFHDESTNDQLESIGLLIQIDRSVQTKSLYESGGFLFTEEVRSDEE